MPRGWIKLVDHRKAMAEQRKTLQNFGNEHEISTLRACNGEQQKALLDAAKTIEELKRLNTAIAEEREALRTENIELRKKYDWLVGSNTRNYQKIETLIRVLGKLA